MLRSNFTSPRCMVALLALTVSAASVGRADPRTDAAAQFHKEVQPILENYCYDCHADGENKGKVAFDQLGSDQALSHNTELWAKVLKNVRAGLMPPAKKDRPNAQELHTLENWIKYGAFGIDSSNPDPGRVTLRRLNRGEYRNTIRELTGVEFKTDEEFPPDDTGYGFDTIGDVLTVSPLLLEKYVKAAESIVTTAVPTVGKVAPEIVLTARQFRDEKDPNPAPPPEGAPRRGGRNRD